MSSIKVRLDAHAFQEEVLCDQFFNESNGYGIVGPEIMKPLVQCRGIEFEYEYTSQTKISDLIDIVKHTIWGKEEVWPGRTIYSFEHEGERYYIADDSVNLERIINRYLDANRNGFITVCALISFDAGQVEGVFPLRFYIRSHEAGKHHEPHVHVCDAGRCQEASIRISDGEIIAGKLPTKLAKIAKAQIVENRDYYYHCWNTMSDGLKVDINHHFGIIRY